MVVTIISKTTKFLTVECDRGAGDCVALVQSSKPTSAPQRRNITPKAQDHSGVALSFINSMGLEYFKLPATHHDDLTPLASCGPANSFQLVTHAALQPDKCHYRKSRLCPGASVQYMSSARSLIGSQSSVRIFYSFARSQV